MREESRLSQSGVAKLLATRPKAWWLAEGRKENMNDCSQSRRLQCVVMLYIFILFLFALQARQNLAQLVKIYLCHLA